MPEARSTSQSTFGILSTIAGGITRASHTTVLVLREGCGAGPHCAPGHLVTHTHTQTIPHPVGKSRQCAAAAFRSGKRVRLREVPGYRPSEVGVRRFWGSGQAMSAVDDRHIRATR